MEGKNHLLYGTITGISIPFAMGYTSPLQYLTFLPVCCLATLLPDIDNPKSMIATCNNVYKKELKKVEKMKWSLNNVPIYLVRIFICAALFMFTKCVNFISIFINKCFGHRTITHAPLFSAFFTILVAVFTNNIVITNAFAAGYWGHLLLDYHTTGGLPLLYPLCRHRFSILKRKSGDKGEDIIAAFLAIFVTFIVFYWPSVYQTITDNWNAIWDLSWLTQ